MAVTLRDIAKRLNLSHATVSFVLNDRRDVAIPEITRQRVLQAAKEMGYRPNRAARALVMGRTNIVGVWMPAVRHHFYAEVLDALSQACRKHGYETLYHRADFANPNVRPFEWPIDGVIAVDVRDILEVGPAPEAMPVISAGAFVDPRHDHVAVDLEAGARGVVSHLVHVAGRRTVYVKVTERRDGRDVGYEAAIAEAGGSPERILASSSDPRQVQLAVREHVRRRGVPDALFCSNDAIALAAIRGMADLGYYPPRDFVIAGFDGIGDSETMSPAVTTVCQPVAELAETAVEMLMTRIREPHLPIQSRLLTPTLAIRETSQRTIRVAESA
ncbi:MAG: LacI family DNA-binding transcriptional regulator [Fimbriimonas sp.]